MLKLGAIDLHDGIGVVVKHFRSRLNYARFSRTSWSKKQHGADWPVWRVHAREENLVKTAHAPHSAFLTHNSSRESLFKILSAGALLIGIEENRTRIVHRSCHFHLC